MENKKIYIVSVQEDEIYQFPTVKKRSDFLKILDSMAIGYTLSEKEELPIGE